MEPRSAASPPPPGVPRTHYLYERYRSTGERSRALAAYYALKPLLPRGVQLAARRAYAARQARREFPAWPAEDVLVEHDRSELRAAIAASGSDRVPFVWYWPEGRSSAVIVTHDVEGPAGIERIGQVLEVERRHGIVSSWNFCGDWYEIPESAFAEVRAAGGEVGLHGIKHDGRLFSSRETFEANLPEIARKLEEWGAVGFRSPATHRNADWMHELGCLYDSSFPDTDPFQPLSGGCCSILPFFFGDVVELPITLVQDQTLWEILRRDDLALWTDKARWIMERHGLVNLLVHPDYLDSPARFERYEQMLAFLAEQRDAWHALPMDVARWWRDRERLAVARTGPQSAELVGPRTANSAAAVVGWARERERGLELAPEHAARRATAVSESA